MTRVLAALALATACTTPTAGSSPAPTQPTPVVEGEAATGVGHPRPHTATRHRTAAPRPVRRAVHRRGVQLDVTAYTWTGNRTASGLWPAVGMAASNRYPLGTRLRVEGVGVVVVRDRVGCCTDLDLYLPSARACRAFGRRHLHVEVEAA